MKKQEREVKKRSKEVTRGEGQHEYEADLKKQEGNKLVMIGILIRKPD